MFSPYAKRELLTILAIGLMLSFALAFAFGRGPFDPPLPAVPGLVPNIHCFHSVWNGSSPIRSNPPVIVYGCKMTF